MCVQQFYVNCTWKVCTLLQILVIPLGWLLPPPHTHTATICTIYIYICICFSDFVVGCYTDKVQSQSWLGQQDMDRACTSQGSPLFQSHSCVSESSWTGTVIALHERQLHKNSKWTALHRQQLDLRHQQLLPLVTLNKQPIGSLRSARRTNATCIPVICYLTLNASLHQGKTF